jgi:polyphosphate kinase
VLDPKVRTQLGEILDVYASDNCSAWDCLPDGTYVRRRPQQEEERRASQEVFIEKTQGEGRARPAAPKPTGRQALPVPVDEL